MTPEFKNILLSYHDSITPEHIKEIEAGELSFPFFSSEEALKLGTHIINASEKYGEEIALMIVRERDQAVIFQYIMDGKSERNINFARMKMKAAQITGHSSLWAFAKLAYGCALPELEENEDALPVGGAYPVMVNGEHVATIALSGLHEGHDGALLIEAIASYLHQEPLIYHGPLI